MWLGIRTSEQKVQIGLDIRTEEFVWDWKSNSFVRVENPNEQSVRIEEAQATQANICVRLVFLNQTLCSFEWGAVFQTNKTWTWTKKRDPNPDQTSNQSVRGEALHVMLGL